MTRHRRPGKHTVYYDLLDACAKGGCPICTLALEAVVRYLDATIYERVNDPQTRDAVVRARGYCNDHAWQLTELRAGFGAALIYRDVLRHVAEEIERSGAEGLDIFAEAADGGSLLGRLFAARSPSDAPEQSVADPHLACPACHERGRYELLVLGTLLEHLGEERMAGALRDAVGLCLVHLARVPTASRDNSAINRLLAIQRECMGELHRELSEFIRKHDYRFRDEGMGTEGNSWLRAIAMAAGQRGVR